LKTADFDFDLPSGLIAQHPALRRDASRLLAVGADGLKDCDFTDLPSLLQPGDLMVYNDTRVIPARLDGKKGLAGIEATLHRRMDARRWRAFVRPAKKLKPGDRIEFAPGFAAKVAEKGEGGEVELLFSCDVGTLNEALERHGRMPLPPYIKRDHAAQEPFDRERYQTIFANRQGAVAAPTAGLHFTPEILERLAERGIESQSVTLHVGAGTFLPVKADDIQDHAMHAEWGEISPEAAERINAARKNGGRIVAVGTTSLRLLESAARDDGTLCPFSAETSIFLTPGHRFRTADALLTNFHLPRSTLFMLVAAFSGLERMKKAYAHAIAQGYRFFSYGDACLLQRCKS
jgi:S-adenosylmethionine:tRNA ribosyltransferase-isomerase